MHGKRVLINIGTGSVLSHAIAAILRDPVPPPAPGGVEVKDTTATVILNSGGHLPTTRNYEDLANEVADSLEPLPLSEYVPEIADAVRALQGRVTPPGNGEGDIADGQGSA